MLQPCLREQHARMAALAPASSCEKLTERLVRERRYLQLVNVVQVFVAVKVQLFDQSQKALLVRMVFRQSLPHASHAEILKLNYIIH